MKQCRDRLLPDLQFVCVLAIVLGGSACGHAARAPAPQYPAPATQAPTGVALYALSRGKGVPDEAQRALSNARVLFRRLEEQKIVLRVMETSIGLEGERRICAEFVNEERAIATYEKLSADTKGVELVNVVVESCVKGSRKQGEKS